MTQKMAALGCLAALALAPAIARAEREPGTWQGAESRYDAPQSRIEEDLDPSIVVYDRGDTQVRLGGLMQMHAAMFVGSDALIDNGDPASNEGFRARRASMGFEGEFDRFFSFHLGMNVLSSDDSVGNLSDARLGVRTSDSSAVYVGSSRVPFTRGAIQSSRHLPTIERPLAVTTVTPSRRLGATFEAVPLDGLGVVVALMNGSEGFVRGNEFGGALWAMRLEYAILDERAMAVSIGLGLMRENGPATNGRGVAGDLGVVVLEEIEVHFEAICDRREPDDASEPVPDLPDSVSRCGGYNTLEYHITDELDLGLQFEIFDDNRDVQDAGDSLLFAGGFNLELIPRHLRSQLHYTKRAERHGAKSRNDSLILVLQGVF